MFAGGPFAIPISMCDPDLSRFCPKCKKDMLQEKGRWPKIVIKSPLTMFYATEDDYVNHAPITCREVSLKFCSIKCCLSLFEKRFKAYDVMKRSR